MTTALLDSMAPPHSMAAVGIGAGSGTTFTRSMAAAPAMEDKQADIILLDIAGPGLGLPSHLPAAAAVSDTANLDTVLLNGEIRKRNGRLTVRRESR
jgi:cytosine/adenosine deaminase-related metal-dependent hydrolase